MSRYYHPPRRIVAMNTARSLIAFLLVACFGILFAGCGTPPPAEEEEFTFTAEDIARFRELANKGDTASGAVLGGSGTVHLDTEESTLPSIPPVLDLSQVDAFEAVRSGPGTVGKDVFMVTNEFLNVRSSPNVTSPQVGRLLQGESVTLVSFVDAAWAKVKMANGTEGYVSSRYISKLVSEDRLAKEKEAYKGQYFVNFGFVNVRKTADAESEKLGELPGQSFVKPLSMDVNWARVSFDGKEGYVAARYLSPFLPNFLVRQNIFTLPILHYRLAQEGTLGILGRHIDVLKKEGFSFLTLKDFGDILLNQQEKDVRVPPKSVVIAVSDVTAANVKEVSDLLRLSAVHATLFIPTKELGMTGITEKTILTLQANGLDLASGGHSGDDLRSLTNAQVELELRQSRKLLEEITKARVTTVGYPEGGVNERVAQFAAQAGYLLGVGVAPDRTFQREQLLRMPSFIVPSTMTDAEVLAIAKGS